MEGVEVDSVCRSHYGSVAWPAGWLGSSGSGCRPGRLAAWLLKVRRLEVAARLGLKR